MALPKKRFRSVLDNVKTTLSGLTTFRALTGTATAAAAAEYIHHFAALDNGTQPLPRIILDIDGYDGTRRGGRYVGAVPVLVMHEYKIPGAYDDNEATQAAWFWDQIEDWFDEFEEAANGGGELSCDRISMTMPPGLLEPDENQGKIVWVTQFSLEVQT